MKDIVRFFPLAVAVMVAAWLSNAIRQRVGRSVLFLRVNNMSKKVRTTNNRTATASPVSVFESITIEQEMDFSTNRVITCKRITDSEEWCVFRLNLNNGASSAELTITPSEMKSLISSLQRLLTRRR